MSIFTKKVVEVTVKPTEELNAEAVESVETAVSEEPEAQKPYVFRNLEADDIFTLTSIIGKIGIKEFKACFEGDTVKSLVSTFISTDDSEEKALSGEDAITALGISIMPALLQAADVILCNLSKCRDDIYKLLSDTSNMGVDEIRKMSIADFAEMVIDFVKKKDFADFFKVVSKSFK